jgi:hypothetical protein
MMALREFRWFLYSLCCEVVKARGDVGHPCRIAASSPANQMWAVTHSGDGGAGGHSQI